MRWRKDFRPGIRYHGQINIGAVHDMTPAPIINVRPYQPFAVAGWYTSARARMYVYIALFAGLCVFKYTEFLRTSDPTSAYFIVRMVRGVVGWWEELPNRPGHFLSAAARRWQPFKGSEASVDDIDYMTRADMLADKARESTMAREIFTGDRNVSRAFTVPKPPVGSDERKMLDELAGWSMTGPYAGPLAPNTHVPTPNWPAAGMNGQQK